MAFQLSPSVEIKEIDLTNVVPAVSTSIGGMAGSFEWGPAEQVVTISTENNQRASFGDPRIATSLSSFNNQTDWYSCANFLSYTSNLKIVRAVSELHKNASEQVSLVGNYRHKAIFTPASTDDSSYTIDFGDSTVVGTNPDGAFQEVDISFSPVDENVSILTAGEATAGVRKRYNVQVVATDTTTQGAAIAQQETITISGSVSAAGALTMNFGSTIIAVDVSNGESPDLVAQKVKNAIQANPIADSASVNGNVVTFTHANAGSSETFGTGVNEETGLARKTVIVSTVPGLTAVSEILTLGRNANSYYISIYEEAGINYYLLVEDGLNAIQIAVNLGKVIRSLPFSYKGSDDPIEVVGDSVTWTNAIFGATPSKDITSITYNNADPTSPTDVTFTISTDTLVGGREGVDPTPAVSYFLNIKGYAAGTEISVEIPGGSSAQKVAALVNEQLTLTPMTYNTEGALWTASIPTGQTNVVRFTAPSKTSTEVLPEIRILDSGSTPVSEAVFQMASSIATSTQGATKNGATMNINGVDVAISEGQTSAELAGAFVFEVNSYQRPAEVFSIAYDNLSSTVNGTGETFSITSENGSYTAISPNGVGDSDYQVNDSVTFLGSAMGGLDGVHDLTATVTSVGVAGGVVADVTAPNITENVVAGSNTVIPTLTFTSTPSNSYSVSLGTGDASDGYTVGDTLVALGTVFGGTTPTNDADITVTAVDTTKTLTNAPVTKASDPTAVGATVNLGRSGGVYTAITEVVSAGDGYTLDGTYYIKGDSLQANGDPDAVSSSTDGAVDGNDVTLRVTGLTAPSDIEVASANTTVITGEGTGADILVTFGGNSTYGDPAIGTSGGADYEVGDQIEILGSELGGVDVTNDLIVGVSSVDSDKTGLAFTDTNNAAFTVDIASSNYSNLTVTNVGDREYNVGDEIVLDSGDLYGLASPYQRIETFSLVGTGTGNGSFSFSGGVNYTAATGDPTIADVAFTVDVVAGVYSVTFTKLGQDFDVGDQLLILGSNLGGVDTTNDLTITINTVGDVSPTITVDTIQQGYTVNDIDSAVGRVNTGTGGVGTGSGDLSGVTSWDAIVDPVTLEYSLSAFTGTITGFAVDDRVFIPGSSLGGVDGRVADGGNDLVIIVDSSTGGSIDTYTLADDRYANFYRPSYAGVTDAIANGVFVDETAVSASSVTGTGAEFTVTSNGSTFDIVIDDGGTGYTVGDTFDIQKNSFTGDLSDRIIRLTVSSETGGVIDGLTLTEFTPVVAPLGDAKGTVATVSLKAGTNTPWLFGAALDVIYVSGDATDKGGIASAILIGDGGISPETGPILTSSLDFVTPVTTGFIGAVQISGSPIANDGRPTSTTANGAIVTVVRSTVEDIAGSASPQIVTENGITWELNPAIDEAAFYAIADQTIFVTDGDVTAHLTKQFGDQTNPAFEATDVTLTGVLKSGGEIVDPAAQKSGGLLSWSYNSTSDETEIVVQHDGGSNFTVGLPEVDEFTNIAPELPTGERVFVNVSELIKNNEDFDIKRTSLDGGYFYAAYAGALGNNIGVAFIDACESEENYESSTFEGNTKFSDIFDGRPSTSDFALQKESGLNDEIHLVVYDATGEITGTKGSVIESYPFLSKNKLAVDDTGRSIYYVDSINASSDYIRVIEGWSGSEGFKVDLTADLEWGDQPNPNAGETYGVMNFGATFNLVGGVDIAPTDGDIMRAYDFLADPETVDVSLMISSDHSKIVKKYVIDICESRRDVLGFISPDFNSAVNSADSASIVNYFNSADDGFISTSYAAFDSGFKYQFDRYNNTFFWCPLNADIAGLCARTDDTNDPWWSPAGESRGTIKNVVRLSFNPDKTARDELYKNRINPVASFKGSGTMLFGDKTAQAKPSAFQQINVRRLFITLEKAISTMARGFLFEFNDAFTRAQFVNTVTPFLRDVQARRGIEGFAVVCDTTNNTPQVINSASFVGDIYIKPNRSINFITLNFVAVNNGVDFEEIINPTGN